MKPVAPRTSLDERRSSGHEERAATPRSALATLAPRPASYDPVARLQWQGEHRVAGLLPLRYERMLESPLAFYRGAALLMSEDLARGPSSSIVVQIGGDTHLSNFGIFSSPERRLVFDVNDFDETDEGPFEWDVKRLVTSLAIACEQLGGDEREQTAVVFDAAKEYQRSIRRFAQESRLDVWYAALDVESILVELRGFFTESALRSVGDVIGRAKSKESTEAFNEMVTYTEAGPRITFRPPLISSLHDDADGSLGVHDLINDVLGGYRATLGSDRRRLLDQFTPVDAARKVVGVGSVGTDDYIILLTGRDDDDPFFLQVKQAQASVVSIARGVTANVHHGERVVSGQKLIQATPDVFLGWHTTRVGDVERSFYVRQLYDKRASVKIAALSELQLQAYGRVCAWVLARAHARSGSGAQIAGYLGVNETFARAMTRFALAYRDQNLADEQALARAATEGRITVAS